MVYKKWKIIDFTAAYTESITMDQYSSTHRKPWIYAA